MNLFGNSLVAVDAETGELKWYFQTVHHELWDYHLPPGPGLSDVPGERSYPTQPFPLKPPPISRVRFTRDDIVTGDDTTPEHAKACQDLWDKFGGLHNANLSLRCRTMRRV